MSIAGEIIDLKLLQSQPIEKWNGDASSCYGEAGRQAAKQRWQAIAQTGKICEGFMLEFPANRGISL